MRNLKVFAFLALAFLVCAVSHNAAGVENAPTNDKIPRIRCLWSLGPKEYQAAALEILEKKISREPFQENYKLRAIYLKKPDEFLKENPRRPP
jgi:hypothetical protein